MDYITILIWYCCYAKNGALMMHILLDKLIMLKSVWPAPYRAALT